MTELQNGGMGVPAKVHVAYVAYELWLMHPVAP